MANTFLKLENYKLMDPRCTMNSKYNKDGKKKLFIVPHRLENNYIKEAHPWE